MSDRPAFARERLISLIIDVGMLRRDVATDVADAILGADGRPAWLGPTAELVVAMDGELADLRRLLSDVMACWRSRPLMDGSDNGHFDQGQLRALQPRLKAVTRE